MPTRLRRLILPTDPEAQQLGKLTEAIVPSLDSDVRRQVTAVPSDNTGAAETKWRRAITEGLATAHARISGIVIPEPTAELDAANVTYHNGTYPTVEAALDHLLYVPVTINSFTNSVGTVEVGSTVSSVVFNWTYNKAVTAQGLSGVAPSLPVGDRNYTFSSPITLTSSFTLTASDGTTNVQATTTVAFRQKRYWGVSANASLTDAEVLALGNDEFSTGRGTSKTISASGQYLYFAYPAAWDTATFTVNGLLNTAWVLVTRGFVNASGFSSSYNIYRSQYALTGTYQIVIS